MHFGKKKLYLYEYGIYTFTDYLNLEIGSQKW